LHTRARYRKLREDDQELKIEQYRTIMINDKPELLAQDTHHDASQHGQVTVPQPAVDPGSYCPNCGSKMRESRCKLSCKTCGFFLSCSDFY